MIKKLLKKVILKIFNPVFEKMRTIENPEYFRLIERAHKAGYNYHQKTVKKEPELLAWVKRENYFDNNDTFNKE